MKKLLKEDVDCSKCKHIGVCCNGGAWVDLEEAKAIAKLELQGTFHHLEPDDEFPSGWRTATAYKDEQCTFKMADGLCAIHKIDYNLKPTYCKEFPYEDGKIPNQSYQLCVQLKKL